jgi:hypothetical protein
MTWCRRLLVLVLVGVLQHGAAANARADAVLQWNDIAVNTAIANAANPFQQARYAAIVQLAVFEAVNAITRDYEPYLGTIHAPEGASAEAAAVAAAYRVLWTYFAGPPEAPTPSAAVLNAARASSLAAIPDGQAKDDGVAAGEAAAAAMIALRTADGSSPLTFYEPGPVQIGVWQATPSCPINAATGLQRGVLLNWRNVTPFGIPGVADFMPGPPPALTSNEYLKAYNEVKRVGNMTADLGDRPQDRIDVARFYAAASPTALASSAARQMAAAKGDSLSENARNLALVNMSINDSLIVSFATKYDSLYWRPETAIRAGDNDGVDKTVGDPSFVPFISTPCFPSYPSNHASGTNGGTEMLRRIYGAAGHDITFANPTLGITLHYSSLDAIANDVDDARVYGGIHYRFDQEAGNRVGRAVATYVYKNNLQRANGSR